MKKLKSSLLTAAFKAIGLINFIMPKRRQLVVNSFPDVEDQLVAVLRRVASGTHDLDVIFLVGSSVPEARAKLQALVGPLASHLPIYNKKGWRGLWSYWRARYVFFTHGMYGFSAIPARQCVVNLWHGMPLKRIWSGLSGSSIPQCTWLLSTSEKYSAVQAEASGLPVQKIPATGLPRNDLLFSRHATAEKFHARIHQGATRVLFFLPTYRKSKVGFAANDGRETDHVLGMTAEEISRFRAVLTATNMRVLVKPHPMSVHYGQSDCTDDRLWIVSDAWIQEEGVTLYEALGQCDGLITDISSVYVDYLVLNRPVFFYFPDLVEYRKTRTFQLEPIEEWLGGPLCTTVSALTEELESFGRGVDRHEPSRRRLAPLLNPQTEANATARLFALVGLEPENSARPSLS